MKNSPFIPDDGLKVVKKDSLREALKVGTEDARKLVVMHSKIAKNNAKENADAFKEGSYKDGIKIAGGAVYHGYHLLIQYCILLPF